MVKCLTSRRRKNIKELITPAQLIKATNICQHNVLFFFRVLGTTSEMVLRRTWFSLLLTGLFASFFLAFYFLQVDYSDLSTIFQNTPLKPPVILSKENGKFNSYFILLFNGLRLSLKTYHRALAELPKSIPNRDNYVNLNKDLDQ